MRRALRDMIDRATPEASLPSARPPAGQRSVRAVRAVRAVGWLMTVRFRTQHSKRCA